MFNVLVKMSIRNQLPLVICPQRKTNQYLNATPKTGNIGFAYIGDYF